MENNILEELECEKEELDSNDDLFNIISYGVDPSVRELVDQYADKDLIKPEMQRQYVWDKKKASKFIESLLLGLPVPSLFLANKAKTDQRLIVDGYQRIRTLYDFIHEGIWHGDDTVFKLTDSESINARWRNKSFEELSEIDKRRLKQYSIHAIVIEQKKPANDSGMFQIFERINTGGTPLTDQEIRNCVYQGNLNSLLIELNDNNTWRKLWGAMKVDYRMKDIEMILRFFALNSPDIYFSNESKIVLKKLLNDCMANHIAMSNKETFQWKHSFERTIEFIYSTFGEKAFYNLQRKAGMYRLRKRLYPTVYDSIMIATDIALERGYQKEANVDWEGRRLNLLEDQEYRESITQGTMKIDNIRTRISKALKFLYNLELQ